MVDLIHLLFFSQGRHFIKTYPEFLFKKLKYFHLKDSSSNYITYFWWNSETSGREANLINSI